MAGILSFLSGLVSSDKAVFQSDVDYYSSRAKSQYLGNNRMLARILGSYNILLNGNDAGLAPHLIMDGFWEIAVTRQFTQYIKPGMHCVDVGANFGYFTLLMSGIAGSTGKVHAFEPNPAITPYLSQTIGLNGCTRNVSLHPVGASNVEGTSFISVNESYPQNGHLIGGNREALQQEKISEVPLRTLDSFGFEALDFIKIDAEGHEVEVLEGAQETLVRFSPTMIIEVNFDRGYTYTDLLRLFEFRHGRTIFCISDNGLVPFVEEMMTSENFHDDWMLLI